MNKEKIWPSRDQWIVFGKTYCMLNRPADMIDAVAKVVAKPHLTDKDRRNMANHACSDRCWHQQYAQAAVRSWFLSL